MVRTISNAFESGRIPQAWILTGVRGVGKTTTARILARALNYELPDGSIAGPTVKMPVLGVHCQAIMESRHLDVIEMDAASHNGVEDVRAINDAVRYAPVSARYKVYILDEVHMLSGAAFNALLKTLEEPPPHAKFVFATTEIRKVPITVLSRCQRFDLRRVDAALLVKHLQGIAGKESIVADTEALALIARAAEGSVRDSLSLFDQAIAHAAGPVRAEDVRGMLGLADRTPRDRSVRGADAGGYCARAQRAARSVRHRRRSRDGARRSRRVHPFRHPAQDRAVARRRRVAHRSRAYARPRLCGQAVDAGAGAHLADAAQGHRRGRGGGPAAGGGRDGSGPHRLRRRSADARRGHPLARRGRARQRRGRGGAVGLGGARRSPARASIVRHQAVVHAVADGAARRPARGAGFRAGGGLARASRAAPRRPCRRAPSQVSRSWWRSPPKSATCR